MKRAHYYKRSILMKDYFTRTELLLGKEAMQNYIKQK